MSLQPPRLVPVERGVTTNLRRPQFRIGLFTAEEDVALVTLEACKVLGIAALGVLFQAERLANVLGDEPGLPLHVDDAELVGDLLGTVEEVAASFLDGRDDIPGEPLLELAGLGFGGPHKEVVDARLGEELRA